MFGFGQANPRRVAEKQLNRAKLELLEVSGSLENVQAQKDALEKRIARLTLAVAETPALEAAPAPTRRERVRSVGNGAAFAGAGLDV